MLDKIHIFTTIKNYKMMDYRKFTSTQTVNNETGECFVMSSKQKIEKRHVNLEIKQNGNLYIEVSIPKFFFGENSKNITDEYFSPFVVEMYSILDDSGIRIIKDGFRSWKLSRIEFSFNLEMSKPVYVYIDSLSKLWSPTRDEKTVYKRESVSFLMKGYKLIFYDKRKQMLQKGNSYQKGIAENLTANILKVELQLEKKQTIDRIIGENKCLKDVFSQRFSIDLIIDQINEILPDSFADISYNHDDSLSLLKQCHQNIKRGSHDNYLLKKYAHYELEAYDFDVGRYHDDFLLKAYPPNLARRKAKDVYDALPFYLPQEQMKPLKEIMDKLYEIQASSTQRPVYHLKARKGIY